MESKYGSHLGLGKAVRRLLQEADQLLGLKSEARMIQAEVKEKHAMGTVRQSANIGTFATSHL